MNTTKQDEKKHKRFKVRPTEKEKLLALHEKQTGEYELRNLVPEAIKILAGYSAEARAEFAYRELKAVADPPGERIRRGQQQLSFGYSARRPLALDQGGRYCPMAEMSADMIRRRQSMIDDKAASMNKKWISERDFWKDVLPQVTERECLLGELGLADV